MLEIVGRDFVVVRGDVVNVGDVVVDDDVGDVEIVVVRVVDMLLMICCNFCCWKCCSCQDSEQAHII